MTQTTIVSRNAKCPCGCGAVVRVYEPEGHNPVNREKWYAPVWEEKHHPVGFSD